MIYYSSYEFVDILDNFVFFPYSLFFTQKRNPTYLYLVNRYMLNSFIRTDAYLASIIIIVFLSLPSISFYKMQFHTPKYHVSVHSRSRIDKQTSWQLSHIHRRPVTHIAVQAHTAAASDRYVK